MTGAEDWACNTSCIPRSDKVWQHIFGDAESWGLQTIKVDHLYGSLESNGECFSDPFLAQVSTFEFDKQLRTIAGDFRQQCGEASLDPESRHLHLAKIYSRILTSRNSPRLFARRISSVGLPTVLQITALT
jgi:hypothetical protein